MIYISIIDDDINFCKFEADLIYSVLNDFNEKAIIKQFHDTQTYKLSLINTHYDILFLDYSFTNETCYQFLDQINNVKHKPLIIIVTASNSLVTIKKAFEYDVFRYITKDYLVDDLKNAVVSAIHYIKQNEGFISIEHNKQNYKIRYSELIGVYTEGHYSVFQLNTTHYRVRESIRKYSNLLVDHNFIQIKSNIFINPNHIQKIDSKVIITAGNYHFEYSKKGLQNLKNCYLR